MTDKIPLDEMARILRESGYRVSRRAEYQRKTFAVAKDLLARFVVVYEELGYHVQDAINEAITQWLDSKAEAVATRQAQLDGDAEAK